MEKFQIKTRSKPAADHVPFVRTATRNRPCWSAVIFSVKNVLLPGSTETPHALCAGQRYVVGLFIKQFKSITRFTRRWPRILPGGTEQLVNSSNSSSRNEKFCTTLRRMLKSFSYRYIVKELHVKCVFLPLVNLWWILKYVEATGF